MKRILPLVLGVFTLVGCDDVQLARSAQGAVDHLAYASAGWGGWEYGYLVQGMRRRQQQWDYHNRFYWGRRPGWDGQVCAPGAVSDPCRAHRGGRRPAVMLASEMNAPPLGNEPRRVYEKLGRAYGIKWQAYLPLLESLNRAAVGDFGGLADLGLNQESLAAAKRNNGRLAIAELDRLGQHLGVNPQKLDSMIQHVLRRR